MASDFLGFDVWFKHKTDDDVHILCTSLVWVIPFFFHSIFSVFNSYILLPVYLLIVCNV